MASSCNDIIVQYYCCGGGSSTSSSSSSSSSVPSPSWRTRLAHILESNSSHVATLVLLLIHLVLTVLDLASFLTTPPSSCSPSKGVHDQKQRLAPHATDRGQPPERPLFKWVEVAILAVLTVKSAALAVALGRAFFSRLGRVVDAAVVAVALVLELVLEGVTGGLVAVVRLWRVLKVVESGMGLRSEVAGERAAAAANAKVDELRAEKLMLEVMVVERDRRIAELLTKLDEGAARVVDSV